MYQMNTGMVRAGFPSVGSWVTYGLGTENQDLPGFVVLQNADGQQGRCGQLGSGLPAEPPTRRRPPLAGHADPQPGPARGRDRARQRRMLDLSARLNHAHAERHPGESDLLARIQNYELAYRMQSEAMEAVDFAAEPEHVKRLYGLDDDVTRPYGEKCLLARRLVERGVRFVQVYCNDEWDAHNNLADNHGKRCRETDQPVAGLLTDLKRAACSTRRSSSGAASSAACRSPRRATAATTTRMASWSGWPAAGVKGGVSHGETDEIGWKAGATRSRSTTCTPRSSTSSASTTRG